MGRTANIPYTYKDFVNEPLVAIVNFYAHNTLTTDNVRSRLKSGNWDIETALLTPVNELPPSECVTQVKIIKAAYEEEADTLIRTSAGSKPISYKVFETRFRDGIKPSVAILPRNEFVEIMPDYYKKAGVKKKETIKIKFTLDQIRVSEDDTLLLEHWPTPLERLEPIKYGKSYG